MFFDGFRTELFRCLKLGTVRYIIARLFMVLWCCNTTVAELSFVLTPRIQYTYDIHI